MSLVQLQPTIRLTLQDGSGSVLTSRLYVRRSLSAAAGLSAVADLRSPIAGISGCVPVEGRYVVTFLEQSPAEPGGAVADTGVFVFETATAGEYLILALPGLHPSFVMTSGPGAGVELDVTKPAIVAFVNAIIAGPWCNPFGYQPTRLVTALYEVRP